MRGTNEMVRISLFTVFGLLIFACGSNGNIGDPSDTGTDLGTDTGSQLDPNDPCVSCAIGADGSQNCVVVSAGNACDDSDCCTENDQCVICDGDDCPASGLSCSGASTICDDGDPCTDDLCDCSTRAAVCDTQVSADGTSCVYDENACTQGDFCANGSCEPGPPIDMDDENSCTTDVCIKGVVEHQPLTQGQCNDGDECTTGDACYLGNCVGGPAVVCELAACASSVSCVTGEGCLTVWLPEGAACDDGDLCTTSDSCTVDNECLGDSGDNCDDGNPCTEDFCGEDGSCNNPTVAGICDDQDPCTLSDSCSGGVCAGQTLDCSVLSGPCGVGICQNGTCSVIPQAGDCNDGDPCTDNDVCSNGSCQGSPKDCSSLDNGCAQGICANGSCVPVPSTGSCDDGNPETCNDACSDGVCSGSTCNLIPGDVCDDAIHLGDGGILDVDLCDFQQNYAFEWCGMTGPEMVFSVNPVYAQGAMQMDILQSIPGIVINYRGSNITPNSYQCNTDYNGFCYVGEGAQNAWGGMPLTAKMFYAVGSTSGSCGPVQISVMPAPN